ncbi:radical SAM/SPASM domain-containing protein [Thermodesulfobacteriota bacterium]
MSRFLINTAANLFINGLLYRYQKITGSPGRPQAISLEITHKCIARCIMCNIWRIPGDQPELPIEEWLNLLSGNLMTDLREIDITGGEPYLLDDIYSLFSGICRLKSRNLKSLKSVAVTTNGFLTERVIEKTELILRDFKKTDMDLVVVCAMDAIGDIHEKVRNVKDAWQKVNRTIEGLIDLRKQYPGLVIGLKTTILPVNIDELEKISKYADDRGLFTIISPCIITSGRYLNRDIESDLVFLKEDKDKMTRFFKGNRFKWSFHAESLAEYFKTGRIKKPCSCGFNYFFVRSSGEVFLCPLINRSIGNIKDTPVDILFSSNRAKAFRKKAGEFPECRDCTEPGLERYALPCEGFTYLGMLLKYGVKDFMELHKHLGLEKYV